MTLIDKTLAELLLNVEVEHGRTSCSDEDANNGYESSSGDWPRCTRCLLLDVVRGNIPEGAEVSLVHLELRYALPNAVVSGAVGIQSTES